MKKKKRDIKSRTRSKKISRPNSLTKMDYDKIGAKEPDGSEVFVDSTEALSAPFAIKSDGTRVDLVEVGTEGSPTPPPTVKVPLGTPVILADEKA